MKMMQGPLSINGFSTTAPVDRRSGRDRRKEMTSWRQMMFYGQRQIIRRRTDRQRLTWVDKYSSNLFISILAVVLLSILDAFLTLFLINNGATEVNPFMAYCLSHGPSAFILIKYAITSISVLILLILSNVFILRFNIHTRAIFPYVIGAFGCVILWELFLIYRYVI
jgi:uncharacterized membrane protein YqjE